jgi:hypothetical protein
VGRTKKLSLLLVALVLGGPVALAAASDASIKALIRSHEGRIAADEGRLVKAIGEFKRSADPAAVEAADEIVISGLRMLASELSQQSAPSARVKAGKAKFEEGLLTIAAIYGRLGRVFVEETRTPSVKLAESKKVLKAVKKGQLQLLAGLRLLS